MSVILKQSLRGTVVTYLGAFIGFLTTFFITVTYLTAEEIGLTRVLFEAALLLSTFAILGVHTSSIRYYPYFKRGDGSERGFLPLMLLFPILGVAIFGFLYFLLETPISSYFSKNSSLFVQYYYMVLPLMLFLLYQNLLEVYASIKQKIVVPRFHKEVTQRLLLIGVYVGYATFNLTLDAFIWIFVGSYGLVALLQFGYVLKLSPHALKEKISFPVEQKKDFFNYTALVVLSALGGSIVSRLDIFMVSAKMGLNYAGIYTIAFFIVAIIEIPSRSLLAITAPIASEALKNKDIQKLQDLYKKVSLYQLFVGGFIFLLIWVNIDFIFTIIPNSEIYSQGKWVVFYLGLSKIVEITFNFGNSVIRYSRYYYYTILITFLLTILTILTNNYFIPLLGMKGASIATLITCLISYTISQIIIKIKLQVSPFSKRFYFLFAVISLLLFLQMLWPEKRLIAGIWFDAILKSFIFVAVPIVALLRLKMLPELSQYISGLYKKIKNRV
ncbi:MAG: lipopolysaccharide biosynthesis protein [Porphyromonas sp.]|nr:lipopolysaccharide biosynthesis protein [Porphyromonas sp.]